MEEQDLVGLEPGECLDKSIREPLILQVGTIGEFLTEAIPQKVKQEPGDGLQHTWEVQWREFLKTVESPQSGCPPNLSVPPPQTEEEMRGIQASLNGIPEVHCQPTEYHGTPTHPGCNGGVSLAYKRMDPSEIVKEECLDVEDAANAEIWRQRFRQFVYQEAKEPGKILSQLRELCCQWLRPERRTKEQILDLMILEQFLSILPQEMQSWVREQGPKTGAKAVTLVEEFLLRLKEEVKRQQKVLGPSEEACGGASNLKQDPVDKEKLSTEVNQESNSQNSFLDNMSSKRKSYSVEYKKGIVEDSLGRNLTAFCKEKMLDIRMVRKWRAEYDNLSQQVYEGNAKKRKCGSGRHPLFPELEDVICEWVADRRAMAVVVCRADIQEFALAMAPQLEISPEDFKASQHWLDGFLQRCELSLRRSTTLFKLGDAEVIQRALAFKSFVDSVDFSEYQLSNMIAMDETAVYMGQGTQTIIDLQGASSVYIPSTGYESARVTCILAIRLDGTKAPPLIITKGKKDKIECVSGIYILETEKAWCTQAVIRKWVALMLPLVVQGSQRGLLVWDSASTHRAKDMKNFLHERKIDQIMIPAGMTSYLQTLDIAIKKPFKDHLYMKINDYIENRMERNPHGNFVKPSLQEVVTWVKNSWEKITDSCVASALRAGYMDKRCSFKESAIARHEKFGPMVLKEIESQEIHDGIQGLESYDDVPEWDDMTVFE